MTADPLDAFGELLGRVGVDRLRAQWLVNVAKLREVDVASPETMLLAAHLVVAALSFVGAHGRRLGVEPFMAAAFDGEPATWKIDDLLDAAVAGEVIDAPARRSIDEVLETRRQIRAAGDSIELAAETGIRARRTVELFVQRALAWLAASASD